MNEEYFQIINDIQPTDFKISEFPNDRDYLIDNENNIYQVLGYVHPLNSVHSLLKYKKVDIKLESSQNINLKDFQNFDDPSKPFYWYNRSNNYFYKRVILNYSTETATKNIQNSIYRKFSEIYGVDFILMPKDQIKYYLNPLKKFQSITNFFINGKWNAISKAPEQMRLASELGFILEDHFDIPLKYIGVTGSMLWDGLHEYSDIDIVIYGLENTKKFINISNQLPIIDKRIRKPSVSELFSIGSKFSMKTGVPISECIVYSAMKSYLFYYHKYFLSISFCPKEFEIKENPLANPQTKFINEQDFSSVTIKARVIDDSWSLFYPSLTYINDVKILDKNLKNRINPNLIKRILVFEKDLTGYYFKGNYISIKGLLQKVENPPLHPLNKVNILESNSNNSFYQIVIGTSQNFGNEFILNLNTK